MKNKKLSLFSLILAFSFFSQNLSAQEPTTNYTQSIKFKPTALIFGAVQLGYEFKVSPSSSIQVDGIYIDAEIGDFEYQGYGGAFHYRYFLKKNPIDGWYAGPFARYSRSETNTDFTLERINYGLTIGYQHQFEPAVVDVFLGPGYRSYSADDPNFDEDEIFSGFGLLFGFSVGILLP